MTELSRPLAEGDWVLAHPQNALGRIIETSALWGTTSFHVWLPSSDSIIRVDASSVAPAESSVLSTHHVTYLAAAARVADALTQDLSACGGAQAGVLLAPIESSVIPLPHQIRALSRAISSDRVRYLLADEVGLGKTIEAGLIMRELKLRGLVRRTLVVAPKGLVTQWLAEMRLHFNEEFQFLGSEDWKTFRRISAVPGSGFRVPGWRTHATQNQEPGTTNPAEGGGSPPRNPFLMFDQVVVPMDSVKPPSKGGGAAQERFEDLISAGWDLVIVDEAHRLGGSTDQVARHQLGRGLAEAAPYLLLLSATPHQGKRDAFHRLISLVDSEAFPSVESVTRERVKPYVIRTEKRRAIDAEGRPLFKPRRTELAAVSWEAHHADQRMLYEAVTEYVREGYNQAIAEKRSYIGFLMILMQRLVVSSTRAIATTLRRRLEVLEAPPEQLSLFPGWAEEEWYDLDGEEQLLAVIRARLKGIRNEQEEVRLLLDAAEQCKARGPDAKAEALLDWIYRLQAEEGDPDLKVLVFTEFVPTQEMLYEFLTGRGFEVVRINGSMSMDERTKAQEAFANRARVLVSTDAGGEGLNLQFCHVVINYDLPWNPMRIEQRIGRVDRIGQEHPVRAVNFVFQESVEHRVREVLEEKLAVIFEELGIDKTGDVLDSAQAGKLFDELYVDAILHPEAVETRVDAVLEELARQAREAREGAAILGSSADLDPGDARRLMRHPLPHWVERMTVSYLQAHGGKAERDNGAWDLTWPDGERLTNVVFTGREAQEKPLSRLLTLENPRVRGLTMRLPPFAPGQPVPVITLPGLAPEIMGFWSLWGISISTADWNRRRISPLFLADDGRVLAPTARHIWDQLLVTKPTILRHLPAYRDGHGAGRDGETSRQAFARLRETAEREGKTIYHELRAAHRERLAREREKAEYAFAARRKAIERIGLPQVRNHRLSLLEQEEERFREQLERRAKILPEMTPLLIVRVEGNHG